MVNLTWDSDLGRKCEGPSEGPSITADARGLLIGVRVAPAASRTVVQGLYGDRLKISVNAAPEGGKANQVLVEALADWLGLARSCVRVVSGHAARDKVVAFTEIEAGELRRRLAVLAQGGTAKKGR